MVSIRLKPKLMCSVVSVALAVLLAGLTAQLLVGIAGLLTAVASYAYVAFRPPQLTLRADGIVVRNLLTTKFWSWPRITGFTRMPLSTGRPGATGAAIVDGRPREIVVLQGPDRDSNLGLLNALVAAQAAPVPATTIPAVDDTRTPVRAS